MQGLKDRFPADKTIIDKRELRMELKTKSIKELEQMLDRLVKEVKELR